MDKNKLAVELFNSKALQYQEKYMDVELYTSALNLFCDLIKVKEAHILDVACGPGNISKYLLERNPDLKILGIDLSKNMVDLARINNPSAQFEVMDCRSIKNLNKQYHAIIFAFCFPYLTKEEALQLIEDAAQLLRPDGVLYISTMEDDYSKSKYIGPSDGSGVRIFTHYHEGAYLIEGLTRNGFTNIETIRQDFPVTHGDPVTDLLLIAKK